MEFFDRAKIKEVLENDIIDAYRKRNNPPDLYSNTLDCFSAVIDANLLNITLDEWKNSVEVPRQTQKSIQNIMGGLHENVIGTVDGYSKLKVGKVIDIKSERHKIIAEIKNKHNTTKGNHKVSIYDDIEAMLKTDYNGYTGYYVEILPPKNNKVYDKPFTPSDNVSKKRRPVNEKIRRIDGKSFYGLITGEPNAIEELYLELPKIVSEILSDKFDDFKSKELEDELVKKFYKEAYG